MDEETIKGAAREAVRALELEGGVSGIIHSGKNWCIQFSGEYGQFCDEFQDQFGHDNSPLVIREKIKKHLLAQVAQLRNKGQRRAGRGFTPERDRAAEAAALLKETVTQTTRAVGDVINRALGVADAGARTAVDVTEAISDTTTRLLEPAPLRARASSRTQKRTDNRKPADVRRTKSPSTGRATKKAATKKAAGKKGASKKRKDAAATKKAGAKKSSRKR